MFLYAIKFCLFVQPRESGKGKEVAGRAPGSSSPIPDPCVRADVSTRIPFPGKEG